MKAPKVGAMTDEQRVEAACREYAGTYDRAVRVYALRSIPRPRRTPPDRAVVPRWTVPV